MRIEERLAWAARQVERIADALSEMRRWRRLGTAFLAGSLSVLALQPFGLWPILFLTIPVLVWLLDGVGEPVRARRRTVLTKAFFTGWFFGFGYFFFGLYWVGEAFLVQADKFAVFLPFAVTLLPAGMAIYIGLAALVARLFWFAGYRRVVVLAVSWTAFEWLRHSLHRFSLEWHRQQLRRVGSHHAGGRPCRHDGAEPHHDAGRGLARRFRYAHARHARRCEGT